MGADFKPVLDGYANLRPFMFWAQTTLPTVFDDSLSYYEVLTKLCKMINVLLENTDTAEHNIEAIAEAYEKLQDYVNHYFDSLDVQQYVDEALDKLVEDGTLSQIIDPIVDGLVGEYLNDSVAEQLPGVVADQIDAVVAEQVDQVVEVYTEIAVERALAEDLPDIVEAQLPDVVGELLPNEVASQIDDVVEDQLEPIVYDRVDDTLPTVVEQQIGPVVEDNINDAVREELPAVVTPYVNTQLQPIVTGWLTDHITNPSNPPLDNTLTVENAAADSWHVGRKFYDVQGSPIYDIAENSKIDSSTGVITTDSDWITISVKVSSKFHIRIKYPGFVYPDPSSPDPVEYWTYGFYTENGTFIPNSGGDWTGTINWDSDTVIIPTIANFIKVSIKTTLAGFAEEDFAAIIVDNASDIAEAIDNINVEVVIDDTLTESGEAADAKVTGDAIRKIENEVEAGVNNIADEYALFPARYIATGGKIASTSGVDRTICIKGKPNTAYRITKNTATSVKAGCWSDDEASVGTVLYSYALCDNTANTDLTVFTDDTNYYIYIQLFSTASDTSDLQSIAANISTLAVVEVVENNVEDNRYRINEIFDSVGVEYLNVEVPSSASNSYWDSQTNIAFIDSINNWRAYDAIDVVAGERYSIEARDPNTTKSKVITLVDDSYNIIQRIGDSDDAIRIINFTIPIGATKLLLTQKASIVPKVKKIILKQNEDSFLRGKNVAIIGDSISTNGAYSPTNLLGNVPEFVVTADDVGFDFGVYITWWDVYKNDAGTSLTNKTVNTRNGVHTLVADDIGAELEIYPSEDDVGKMFGIPDNNNSASTDVWWEIIAQKYGFNPIPVAWSGSSVTSHEGNKPIYKCSYAWHESQIRKCGIRTPGSASTSAARIPPDVVIIFKGVNDFSHSPYTRLTDCLEKYPFHIPTTDEVEIDGNTKYGYIEGLIITINKIHEAYPEAQIMLCTFNYFKRMTSTFPGFPSRNGINTIYQYNDAIRAVANYFGLHTIEFDKDGITYANAASGAYYNEGTNPSANHTHPNNKGHKVLANRAEIDIKKLNNMI